MTPRKRKTIIQSFGIQEHAYTDVLTIYLSILSLIVQKMQKAL